MLDFRITSKSCESLYSNSSKGSASILYRSKGNAGSINKSNCFRTTRQPAIIPATNEVRQRVLSARRLRMKTYQNQLADAQQTIAVSLKTYVTHCYLKNILNS